MFRKILYPIFLFILLFNSLYSQSEHTLFNPINAKDSLQSSVLQEQRDFWVVIPEDIKDYDRLPVIYLLDGDQQLKNLHAVYSSYWGHHLPRMVLVGIDNSRNRTRDLTISKVEQHWEANGEADKFALFIKDELVPYIDNKYPVTKYRTLIGHSYGGLFTINMLIEHPDLFQNYIAIDPSIDWDNQRITKNFQKAINNADYGEKHLYLSLAGPLDRDNEEASKEDVMTSNSPSTYFARSVLSFIDMVENANNGPSLHWEQFPGEIHGSVPLISMINGLKHQFKWYQLENLSEFNNPMTSAERISELLDYRSAKLEKHFGYVVPPADAEMLMMGGEMFGQMGQPEKGLLFLEKGVEYYPKDDSMWMALASYYESTGNKESAIKSLRKGLSIINSEALKIKLSALEKK